VHKHVTLAALLTALKRKEKGFLYLETHAGRGAYDLADSAESRASAPIIERVIGSAGPRTATSRADSADRRDGSAAPDGAVHPEIAAYTQAIASWRAGTGRPLAYPGSPLIAAMQLRPQDRAVLIELLPDEAAALGRGLAAWPRLKVVNADGFERLKAFLPPSERRGLTFIDPPYEETQQDFARVAASIAEALRRFATGIIAVWYPIKDARDTAAWLATVRPRISRETLVSELWLHPCDSRVALNGSGLLIINPPHGIAERMRAWLPALHALLDAPGAGGCRVLPVE